jgi:hypothetical protein
LPSKTEGARDAKVLNGPTAELAENAAKSASILGVPRTVFVGLRCAAPDGSYHFKPTWLKRRLSHRCGAHSEILGLAIKPSIPAWPEPQ